MAGKRTQCLLVVLLLLSLHDAVPKGIDCDSESFFDNTRLCLHRKLEGALTSELYNGDYINYKEILLAEPETLFDLDTNIQVDYVCLNQTSANYCTNSTTELQLEYWLSYTARAYFVLDIYQNGAPILWSDPLGYCTSTVVAILWPSATESLDPVFIMLDITITVPKSNMPLEEDIQNAWENILPWLKVYAGSNGQPVTYDNKNGGYLEQCLSSDCSSPSAFWNAIEQDLLIRILRQAIVAANIMIYLLICSLLMISIPSVFLKLRRYAKEEQEKNIRLPSVSIFWAAAALTPLYNIARILVFLLFPLPMLILPGDMAIFIIICVLWSVSLLSELILCVVPKKSNLVRIPGVFYCSCCSCCCRHRCCFRCCRIQSDSIPTLMDEESAVYERIPTQLEPGQLSNEWSRCSRSAFIQTFAVWNIVAFLQSMGSSVVPFSLQLICSSQFMPTLVVIGLIASLMFWLLMIVAYIFHTIRKGPNARTTEERCIQAFQILCTVMAGATFLGLVIILALFYASYVVASSGATVTGLSAIITALIPAALVSTIGWIMKERLLKDEKGTSATYDPAATNLRETRNREQVAIQIVQSSELLHDGTVSGSVPNYGTFRRQIAAEVIN